MISDRRRPEGTPQTSAFRRVPLRVTLATGIKTETSYDVSANAFAFFIFFGRFSAHRLCEIFRRSARRTDLIAERYSRMNVFPLCRRSRRGIRRPYLQFAHVEKKYAHPEKISLKCRSRGYSPRLRTVYSLVNSLFVHLGQGGMVSPLPRCTLV